MVHRFMTSRRVGARALELYSFEVSLFLQQHIILIKKKKVLYSPLERDKLIYPVANLL